LVKIRKKGRKTGKRKRAEKVKRPDREQGSKKRETKNGKEGKIPLSELCHFA